MTMLLFETAGDAPFALADVDSRPQLPFEDLLVVAGRLAASPAAVADHPRQFTGVGGRVKADGKRRLVVFALPSVATDKADDPCVQVLEVGEGAALFLQDTRACFPSLVKKNPLTLAMDLDEDDSDSSEDDEDASGGDEPQRKQRKKSEKARPHDDPAPPPIDAETLAFMGRTRVKVLPTFDEFFRAYQVADAAQVAAAVARDRTIADDSQVLCLEFPASSSPIPAAVSSGETKLNFGVLFCHATAGGRHASLLHVPLPRSVRLSGQVADGEEDECFQDATVLSFGTHRESTLHGGGKSSGEMVQNIRMRHASGTFCTLVLPATDWSSVADKHQHALPQVRDLHGELRLRRIMGPAPNGEPVELQLEV